MDDVALLAEGVDRNSYLSFRTSAMMVALLAEGVDRNFKHRDALSEIVGRPPRGGRG